jgi:hypothetical protein
MKILKLILTLGVMAWASLANAGPITIDAKAYHEQRQAEKKARLEADKKMSAAIELPVLPVKSEQKAKVAQKGKKGMPVIDETVTVPPEEKIEQLPAEITPEVNTTVNAVIEPVVDTTIYAEQPTPPEAPQSL